MSSIKLKHSSGNSMSIAAPATNPASDLSIKLPATVGAAGQILKNGSTAGTLEFGGVPSMLATSSSYEGLELQTPSGDGSGEFHIGVHQAGSSSGRSIVFKRGGSDGMDTESMRIDANGHLLVSRTASIHGGKLSLDYTNGTSAGMAIKDTLTSGTGVPLQVVNGSGTIVGSITMNQSNTAFNTSSDYRLKENVVAISDGITRLKTLKPSRFNWISDLSNTTIDGFLAHEVTAVPEAVQGEKDAVATEDSERGKKGDPIYQQIDQSKLIPLLTAALQEAIAKIEALETKVTALEAA